MNKPHKRFNPLTGEWILVSPQRTERPWLGKSEKNSKSSKPSYDPECYLCPGNVRANSERNPNYKGTYVFVNDFSALLPSTESERESVDDLIIYESERGICKVVCFSPRHDLTLPDLSDEELKQVIRTWKSEYEKLGNEEYINHVQIFENKGEIMGASNPHPHGQIWAQESIPIEPRKEGLRQKEYYEVHRTTLLKDYVKLELGKKERILFENKNFVVLVPYWAVWPFETMIVTKDSVKSLSEFNEQKIDDYAEALQVLTRKYDNLFDVSFPYSAGIHQAPTDGKEHSEWHFHMHFYPPLLRSATIKKFMVGYEMLANPQRDITAETAAQRLREISAG